jgi:lipopolysaccharide/colanic/teichoic acid biosynthesis glycosyltransferase
MSVIIEPPVRERTLTLDTEATSLKRTTQPGHPGFSFDDLIQSENITILRSAKDIETMSLQKVLDSKSPIDADSPCIFVQEQINNVRYINKFFEKANQCLPTDGLFIGCVQTATLRKKAIFKKWGDALGKVVYPLDYIVNRVFPKIPYIKKAYFGVTKGRNRALTEMEILGRLYSCGFALLHRVQIGENIYFVVRKVKEPEFNVKATYGPIITLQRMGENKKKIRVYKLRTMYPYSEYLQPYVYELRGLQEGGKIKNDPRINSIGNFCRKYWLDEIPMLYNLIRGDLKFIGVRPLSSHYLSLYPKEFQEYRNNFKPGLIPPYYADMPKTFDEIKESEERYLRAYEKNKFKTDLKYLYKILYNIFIRGSRSK